MRRSLKMASHIHGMKTLGIYTFLLACKIHHTSLMNSFVELFFQFLETAMACIDWFLYPSHWQHRTHIQKPFIKYDRKTMLAEHLWTWTNFKYNCSPTFSYTWPFWVFLFLCSSFWWASFCQDNLCIPPVSWPPPSCCNTRGGTFDASHALPQSSCTCGSETTSKVAPCLSQNDFDTLAIAGAPQTL